MKEFEKKSSPSREGFSKFLPASMSDAGTRRRLTEYEIQVQDLQAYVRSLEAETVHLRKKLEDTPKDFMVLENKLREANRQLVQAFNQNEKLVNALYEARDQRSEEHTSELQSRLHLVCRLLLEKKKKKRKRKYCRSMANA